MTEHHHLKLLHIDADTLFVTSPTKRIERQNDPEHSSGPRLFFAGCSQGNFARVGHDIDDEIAEELLAIAATEPQWRDPWVLPQCIGKLLDVLSKHAPSAIGAASRTPLTIGPGFIYQLPNHLKYERTATIVRGESREGAQMLARFAAQGSPPALIDAGFKDVCDFWEPWCVAIEDNEIAAIAFAARLSGIGAEIGVYTFPKFRSRGFAAAVTAAWSSMPSLDGRALFYSTSRSNRSSQRVASRLDLRMIGASVAVD